MGIRIENKNRQAFQSQAYKAILRTSNTALYKQSKLIAPPMASVSRAIEKILRTHLGVSRDGFQNVGIATGALKSRLNVTNGELKIEGGATGLAYSYETFNITMEYELDLKTRGLEYGYAIGAEDGYAFRPSVQQILSWIIKKGYAGFVWEKNDGSTHPVTNRKQAARAAARIVRGSYGKPNIVLPNWYLVNDNDDTSEVDAIVKRTSNLYMNAVGKEIESKNNKRK